MITVYLRPLDGAEPHGAGLQLLNEISGSSPVYTYGPYGKPYWDRPGFFNLSHSKSLLGVAVGERELGLDIEDPRPIRHTGFVKPEEQGIDPLHLFVVKESFVKLTGDGLRLLRDTLVTPLTKNTFSVQADDHTGFVQVFFYGESVCALATAEQEDYCIVDFQRISGEL